MVMRSTYKSSHWLAYMDRFFQLSMGFYAKENNRLFFKLGHDYRCAPFYYKGTASDRFSHPQ
jgi:hypothetical protein